MPKKDKNIISSLKFPWITKDGYIDFTKFPIDSILRNSLSEDERRFSSSCEILSSMYLSGRLESAVFLYGLIVFYRNDIRKKETIVNSLRHIKTVETADLLFRELNETESSNSTRCYINTILESLCYFPLHLVEGGFNNLLKDSRWSYKMKQKFREILYQIKYRCKD